MKLSDIMAFVDEMKSAVSSVVKALDDKLTRRVDEVEGRLNAALSESKSFAAETLEEIRAAMNLQAEDFRTELEAKSLKTGSSDQVRVKSISVEDDGKLRLYMTDDSFVEGEINVPAGPVGASGVDGKNGDNGKDGVDGRDGVDGKPGSDGENGKDGVGIKAVGAEDGKLVITLSDDERYSFDIPTPEKPRDPVDVTDAAINRDGELLLVLSNGSTKNLGKVVGSDGMNGINGMDGRDGKDGERGPEGPAGKDGTNGVDGVDGADGVDGKDGKDGADGLPGKDGVDGAPGRDGRDGIDGKDGRDGLDGVGFDDMDALLSEDNRTFVLSFRKGENVKTFSFSIPAMLFRGAYDSDRTYQAGDVVSYGGSTFHANAEVVGLVPDSHPQFWTQQTQAGRSIRGERGIPGKDGRNGVDGKDLRAFT